MQNKIKFQMRESSNSPLFCVSCFVELDSDNAHPNSSLPLDSFI